MNKHQHAHSVEPYAVDRYRIVAECLTCCGQHTGGIGPNGFNRCFATIPGDNDACVPLPLSRLDYLGHFAGHDVRPVVKP